MKARAGSLVLSLIAAMSVCGIAIGIVAAQRAGADSPQAAAATTPTATPSPLEAVDPAYLAELAKNLGVTVDALKAALVKTGDDTIAQALLNKTITQAQADELKQAVQGGDYFAPLSEGHREHHGHGGGVEEGVIKAVADYVGLTSSQLEAEITGGKSLAAVATAQGKTVDGLKTAITDAVKAALDQAVKAGDINQAQADTASSTLATNLDTVANGSVADILQLLKSLNLGWGGHGDSDGGSWDGPGDGPTASPTVVS